MKFLYRLAKIIWRIYTIYIYDQCYSSINEIHAKRFVELSTVSYFIYIYLYVVLVSGVPYENEVFSKTFL